MTSIRTLLEEAVATERFTMRSLSESIKDALSNEFPQIRYQTVASVLGNEVGFYLFQSLVRAAFLIELVKTPKIETTKMEVRWTPRLAQSDPRYASYEICIEIFDSVWAALEQAISDQENCLLLWQFFKRHLVAYEIPLDYEFRLLDSQIHRPENIIWLWGASSHTVMKLRAFLMESASNTYARVFTAAYHQKIQVKTYLTDRVLTGLYKTNREKRWEAHPASVHFALRRSCLDIEHALITQLCHFNGFPSDLVDLLDAQGLLLPGAVPFRCPITQDLLDFSDFQSGILDPVHGKSDFQVGHLNPLKALNNDPQTGHTAQNISWISSDGNRIQGSLTLAQTRTLLGRIVENYAQLGLQLGEERGVNHG